MSQPILQKDTSSATLTFRRAVVRALLPLEVAFYVQR